MVRHMQRGRDLKGRILKRGIRSGQIYSKNYGASHTRKSYCTTCCVLMCVLPDSFEAVSLSHRHAQTPKHSCIRTPLLFSVSDSVSSLWFDFYGPNKL
ncbi:hypothetical protein GUJ93_ZPchr0013g36566 [Zizania palustris]|uniref:Uncharacterized protein n=1 Tax=Zizania palustris TaxID=103762 RepID=A0A8J5WU03_ZIZPA|nr:hypothetical protein GUJ93_ZPchr0013g36566 [Zizania palustris]